MNKVLLGLGILALAAGAAQAQNSVRPPYARASGSATVSVKPDQLKFNVGVVTQAVTAQESSSQNAAQVERMLSSLKEVLGSSGEIRTVSYSVSPVYQSGTGGGIPTLVGYRTTNIVEATTGDLSLGGRLIDTATAAGANTVQGLRFSLKDPEPVRAEALRMATGQAKTNAESIASGLGMQIGKVVSAEESSAVRSIIYTDARIAAGGTGSTPVETGMVEVSANVVVEAELR